MKWNRMYLVLNGKDTLNVFGDETMKTEKVSFQMTTCSLYELVKSIFGAFKLTMKSTESDIQIVFKTENERRGFKRSIIQFVVDQKGDSVKVKGVEQTEGILVS